MTAADEKGMTKILLDIKGEVGETKGKVEGMCEDICGMRDRLDKTVLREDCTGKHKLLEEALARELGQVRSDFRTGIADLKAEVRNTITTPLPPAKPASGLYPKVPAAAAPPPMTVDQIEKELKARQEGEADARRRRVTWYIGTAGGLLALITTFGSMLWKMTNSLHTMQTQMAQQPEQLRAEVKEELKRNGSKVIYVPVPADEPRRVATHDPPAPPDTKATKKATKKATSKTAPVY